MGKYWVYKIKTIIMGLLSPSTTTRNRETKRIML